jgi:hypothetical protein
MKVALKLFPLHFLTLTHFPNTLYFFKISIPEILKGLSVLNVQLQKKIKQNEKEALMSGLVQRKTFMHLTCSRKGSQSLKMCDDYLASFTMLRKENHRSSKAAERT